VRALVWVVMVAAAGACMGETGESFEFLSAKDPQRVDEMVELIRDHAEQVQAVLARPSYLPQNANVADGGRVLANVYQSPDALPVTNDIDMTMQVLENYFLAGVDQMRKPTAAERDLNFEKGVVLLGQQAEEYKDLIVHWSPVVAPSRFAPAGWSTNDSVTTMKVELVGKYANLRYTAPLTGQAQPPRSVIVTTTLLLGHWADANQ
jgi:hypothetical protein